MPIQQNPNKRRGEERSETLIIPHITREMLEVARAMAEKGASRAEIEAALAAMQTGKAPAAPAARPAPAPDTPPRKTRLLAALCYLNVLILIPACCKQRHDAFVKFHLNQGLVVLALATVCACVGFLPHCSELGLTLTLLVDALSLVGLVQTLRGLQTPLPLIWRITKSFHPFT